MVCSIGSWSTTAGPWGDRPAHRYTPLTVWLRRYGVAVSHSRPYHPQTLGKDERIHGTLQRELLAQPPRARPGRLAGRLRCLAPALQPRAAAPEPRRRRARQPLPPQPTSLWPRAAPAAPPARGPRAQSPGPRLGLLPRSRPQPAQGPARLGRGLPPHRHRRVLGRGLHDRALAHHRSAPGSRVGQGVNDVPEPLLTMCPVWTVTDRLA